MFKQQQFVKGTAWKVALVFSVGASVPVLAQDTMSTATSQLMSQQMSVVANSIHAETVDCGTGQRPGSIGHSIQQAMSMHIEIASTPVDVERLFEVGSDCFGGLSQIFDLSNSIPSLGSIISAAQTALLRFAEKKVCTVARDMSTMVTAPINQSLANISGLSSFGDLNGMTNGLIHNGLSRIDPYLGQHYIGPLPGTTYTVDTNPFNIVQTDFGGTGGGGTGTGAPTGGGGTLNQMTMLSQQIAEVQGDLGPAQLEVQRATQALGNCQAAYGVGTFDCAQQEERLATAQTEVVSLESELRSLQNQLSVMSASGTQPSTVSPMSAPAPRATAPTEQRSRGFIESVNDLFK